jgi:hypothetical protein
MTSLIHNVPGVRGCERTTPVRRPDPLPRLLRQLVARAGEPCAVIRTASRPWASALFQGRRHEVTMTLVGADAAGRLAAMAEGIGETEWSLQGHFVADITADTQQVVTGPDGVPVATLELSALTIEEW